MYTCLHDKLRAMASIDEDVPLDDEKVLVSIIELAELRDAAEVANLRQFDAEEETKKVTDEKDREIEKLKHEIAQMKITTDTYEEYFDLKKVNVNKKKFIDMKIQNRQALFKKEAQIEKMTKEITEKTMRISNLTYGDLVYIESEQTKKENLRLESLIYDIQEEHSTQINKLVQDKQDLLNQFLLARIEITRMDMKACEASVQLAAAQEELNNAKNANKDLILRIAQLDGESSKNRSEEEESSADDFEELFN